MELVYKTAVYVTSDEGTYIEYWLHKGREATFSEGSYPNFFCLLSDQEVRYQLSEEVVSKIVGGYYESNFDL